MMKFCQEHACEQRGSTGAPVICPTAFQQETFFFLKKHLFDDHDYHVLKVTLPAF